MLAVTIPNKKFLDTNYNLSDNIFYNWLIKNTSTEGRYYEKPMRIDITEDKKLSRGREKYGMKATKEINNMLGVMEYEFKDIIDRHYNQNTNNSEYHDYGEFPIYIDFYKKIEFY